MAATVQPSCLWNSQKICYKTFSTNCRPRLYFMWKYPLNLWSRHQVKVKLQLSPIFSAHCVQWWWTNASYTAFYLLPYEIQISGTLFMVRCDQASVAKEGDYVYSVLKSTWRVFNSPISDLNFSVGILICKLKCKVGWTPQYGVLKCKLRWETDCWITSQRNF